MFYIVITIIELAVLFLISRKLTSSIYSFIYLITNSRLFAYGVLNLSLFPGTVAHELSHLFTAEILGVPTGKLTLTPKIEELNSGKSQNYITNGSVMIAKSDPFRRAAIGLAPLFNGVIILTIMAYYLPIWGNLMLKDVELSNFLSVSVFRFILSLYFTFAVSNSMYTSASDTKGLTPLILTLVIIGIIAYLAGLRFMPPQQISSGIDNIFLAISKSLGLVLAVNLLNLLIATIGIDLMGKLLHKQIVYHK
jgi:hypothetical protein